MRQVCVDHVSGAGDRALVTAACTRGRCLQPGLCRCVTNTP